jgi:hypothetical protein
MAGFEQHTIRTRYRIGDRIRITPEGATPFSGLEGLIQEVQPHDQNIRALDRYIVLFKWGERQSFYDVQLTPVDTSR